jgi:hypothetical protein
VQRLARIRDKKGALTPRKQAVKRGIFNIAKTLTNLIEFLGCIAS